MKQHTWALISDIHGNLKALEEALECARQEGADRLAFLGDALGGPDDEACCRLLMRSDLAVFGNRELRVRLSLSEDARRWMRSLPATAVIGEVLLCHSSPTSVFPSHIRAEEAIAYRRGHSYWKQFPYISGRASVIDAADALAELGLSAVFFAHTHRQDAWRVSDGVPNRLREREFTLGGGGITLVGLGSVGEAPDGGIEFGIYDAGNKQVRLMSIAGG